jgi:hypothetical protein
MFTYMYPYIYMYMYMYMYSYINAGMPDCPASGQSGTGMKKTIDARTILVLD